MEWCNLCSVIVTWCEKANKISKCFNTAQKKNELLGHLEPIDVRFFKFLVTFAICLASEKAEQNESSKSSMNYYGDYWSLLYAKITFWGFAWAFAGRVSSVWENKVIEFLINCMRKNLKYFARTFYKKLTYLKSIILLMSHFRRRL